MNRKMLTVLGLSALVASSCFVPDVLSNLVVTSSDANYVTKFAQDLTECAGKTVTIDAQGRVSSIPVPPPPDNGFASYLRQVIDDSGTTQVAVERNAPTVLVGSFNLSTIDLDDTDMLDGNGSDGKPTKGGGIIHEIWEQYQKQVQGKGLDDAHSYAIKAENCSMPKTKRRCGVNTEYREEDGKQVVYIPFEKDPQTPGYARVVLTGSQIASVSFVNSVPNPKSPPSTMLLLAQLPDTSFVGTPATCMNRNVPSSSGPGLVLLLVSVLSAALMLLTRRYARGA